MSNIVKIVGERIKYHRLEKSLSQEQLALMAGLSPTSIGKLERGQKNPSLLSLEKILNALEVSFEEFFKYIQPSTKEYEDLIVPLIVNKVIRLSKQDQKEVMNILDSIVNIKKSDR
ncbi:DNA-binding transcriptional regulator, XRE-family HTH domain [Sporobacter termitidis DSM 10068]|uniref:DNA-binding transcriptional regulator, XRE-family HTH domain n=1 Tax=Sporobacter termitidis DSM 10068 TaxID=1123282 RepID=A0A1M5VIQ2_9FIRM|nr:helix-turn-helix transcriptional regulator [Sporobacter termitidis]SHH75111.1 DNA-binding transcriptional regulator, XRE-family HTH domain [Sporobacter termitidis DSM 10068]